MNTTRHHPARYPARSGDQSTDAVSRALRSRHPRADDHFLYPALIDRHPLRSRPTLWDRLLWMIARRIDDKTGRRERRRLHTDGIHRYQRELGARANQVLIGRVRDGWWVGPPPYGYRITTHQVSDDHGRRTRRHKLAVDDQRAPVVPRIFTWFVRDHLGPTAIAARLATDPDRYPPPVDHSTGRTRPWTPGVVRGIVSNTAYLGYVVRGRTRRGRPQPDDRWIRSRDRSHPHLVEADLFWAARDTLHPALRPPDTEDGSKGGSNDGSEDGGATGSTDTAPDQAVA